MKLKSISTSLLLLSIIFFSSLLGSCKKEDGIFDIKPSDFLRDTKYSKLVVEVVAVHGFEPDTKAIQNLQIFLEARLNKPKGVVIIQKTIQSPENNSFTPEDLRSLEDEVRSEYTHKHDLAAYIFYADKGYHTDGQSSKTLGVAYSSSGMCIFKKTIDDNSGGLGQVSTEELESAVLIHEFGHILGLVNNGTAMTQNHEDPTNPGHCDNKDCLMYYASNTSDILSVLGSGEIPDLDSQCLNDLKAAGGK